MVRGCGASGALSWTLQVVLITNDARRGEGRTPEPQSPPILAIFLCLSTLDPFFLVFSCRRRLRWNKARITTIPGCSRRSPSSLTHVFHAAPAVSLAARGWLGWTHGSPAPSPLPPSAPPFRRNACVPPRTGLTRLGASTVEKTIVPQMDSLVGKISQTRMSLMSADNPKGLAEANQSCIVLLVSGRSW